MNERILELLIRAKNTAGPGIKSVQAAMSNLSKDTKTKMQSMSASLKENWLVATAAITGAFLLIKQAWDLLDFSSKVEQQRKAFDNLAKSYGANAEKIISDLKRASAETMSTVEIVAKASKAMILGLDPSQYAKLMEISRAAAQAMGESVGFMFDSIVLGIGRQSRMILDNLGIIVKADEAYINYAKTLGKAASELTDAEKRQAFFNATLEAGEDIIKKVNIQFKSQQEYLQSVKARLEDFKVSVGKALWVVLGTLQISLDTLRSGFAYLLELLATGAKGIVFSLVKIAEGFEKVLTKIPKIGKKFKGFGKDVKDSLKEIEGWRKGFEESGRDFAKDALSGWQGLTQSVKDNAPVAIEAIQEVGDKTNYIGTKLKDVKEKAKESFSMMEEFAKQSASNIQNAFSDFFFKAFTGELTTLKEAFSSFAISIAKTISNIMAQWAAMKIVTGIRMAAGVLMQGAAATYPGDYAPAGYADPVGMNAAMHQGGTIRRKAHSGLATDEVNITALTGEGVISRKGMNSLGRDGFDRINRGENSGGQVTHTYIINAVDPKSFADLLKQQPGIIAEIVDKGIRNNSGLRKTIQRFA